MSLFAIADTHLSLGTDKPMDIFKGWSGYVDKLKENWERAVTDSDTVVIAGDISWGMSLDGALEDFKFIDSLPGQKIILKGNHDYWWTTMKKMDTFLSQHDIKTIRFLHNNTLTVGNIAVCGSRGWFFDAEESADNKVLLREAGRLRTSINLAKETGLEPVVFLHYPPITQNMVCEEIYNVLLETGIKRCYYGHLHGPSMTRSINSVRDGIEFALISCDFLAFAPKLVQNF